MQKNQRQIEIVDYKITNTKKAFSLVEMLAVFGIMSLIGVSVFMVLSQSGSTQSSLTDKLALQMEARRAADVFTTYVSQCSEIVRPSLGETTDYLVARTFTNQILLFRTDEDKKHSTDKFKVKKLIMYKHDHADPWAAKNHHEIMGWVDEIKFTSVSPSSVILNITQKNQDGKFQFVTSAGLLNAGELE